jgi:hypothetical protein
MTHFRCSIAALALAPVLSFGASAPFLQLIGAPGAAALAAGTCDAAGPIPQLLFDADLPAGTTYRYSPAVVTPYYFDDEGEFNLIWNQDATLYVSPAKQGEGAQALATLPMASLDVWFAALARVPEHTQLAMRAVAYDVAGKPVSASRISWDCTTGAILSVEHRGNATGSSPYAARVIEYYNAAFDHYFITADAAEIFYLDTGVFAGWQRTGAQLTVFRERADATSPVCRFYIPPALGDSHFYSASPAECAAVRAKFPAFFYESADLFSVVLPDATGQCATGLRPVYRLWNARADSNHRYTTDVEQKAAMIAKGYVAEGYGAAAVAFCGLP